MPKSTADQAHIFCGPQHREIARCLADMCGKAGLIARAHANDLLTALDVFKQIRQEGAKPALIVFGGGEPRTQSALGCAPSDWEDAWRETCYSGALIGQDAINAMEPHGCGTLIYLGHISSSDPRAWDAAHAAAGAGLRSFAQSMARGCGPKGIHVVHLLLADCDAQKSQLDPAGVAAACWQLHQQDPSTWTHEMDLRPSSA